MAYFRKRNGFWEFRISYKDTDGKFKQKSRMGFKTKKAAELEASRLEMELMNGNLVDKDITLYEYFKNWIDVHKKHTVSDVTLLSYQNTLKKIKIFFKDTKLKNISITSYQKAINKYSEKYAQDTVERFNIHIKSAVKMAVHERYIDRNFCDFVKIKAKNKGRDVETKFLQKNEYLKLIDVAYKKREFVSYACIYLIAKTGMRFAECLAITVNDIDYENKYLSVNKTWDYKMGTGYKPTKNKSSVRNIPVDDETIVFLKEYSQGKNERIFKKVSNNSINKTIKGIVKREASAHSLRHTYASYLILKGIDLISISQVLGHENLNITLEVYAHQLDEQKSKNDEIIRTIWK